MSRIHDALRKAGQDGPPIPAARRGGSNRNHEFTPVHVPEPPRVPEPPPRTVSSPVPENTASAIAVDVPELENLEDIIVNARQIPFDPSPDSLMVHPDKPRDAPSEEFRSLRTRLNHLQSVQPLHTLVVTSASPAEGKSFTAANLAISQAQLADKRILLADFDFRRPNVDRMFQVDTAPGITDYLRGKATLAQILRRVEGSDLFILTAGEAVPNPLELLNLKECKSLIDALRNHFDWVILDSPPLLFAADGNLLATMCDGTILVVRIGATTFDSVNRALQSLCENNVIGTVVNGARRGELYSKYSYYHDYSQERPDGEPPRILEESIEE